MKQLISIIILIFSGIFTFAQETPIQLITDRSSYISGDEILFCILMNNQSNRDTIPGYDVYVDITDASNEWITGTGTVSRQDGSSAYGAIVIPDSLLSGYYKVRAYTNYPNTENNFCSKEIFVSNRFGNNQENILRSQHESMSHNSSGQFITTDKDIYERSEKITLTFPKDSVSGVLRIVSKKQWDEESEPMYGTCPAFQINDLFAPILPYNGIIVSGIVTDSVTGSPISNAVVFVSMQDSIVRLKYDFTDNTGAFCVLLNNYFGEQQIFINVFTQQLEPYFNAKVKLRNQFGFNTGVTDNLYETELKTDHNELDKAVIAKAYDIKQYSLNNSIPNRPALSYDNFIVGQIRNSVLTSDYIEFANMKEITREILKFVRIRKDKSNVINLHVVNDKGITNPHHALVLVDGVPLTSIEKIMDKGSDKIKKIDTQNSLRHFGNISINNGLIMIWTHKLDFWEKCQVPGTFSFLVQNFQQPSITTDTEIKSKDKVPNLKQTIYWNPNINTATQNSIDIPLSVETGEFVIEFIGIGNNCNYIRDFKLINVK